MWRIICHPSDDDETRLYIGLSKEDTDELKRLEGLGTAEDNTFLSWDTDAVDDMAGNNVTARDVSSGLGVREYTSDATEPHLVAYELDMDAGVLTMTFSETIKVSSANANSLTLHGSANGGESHTLTGGDFSEDDSTVVSVALTRDDLNSVKVQTNLAVSEETTFLSIDGGAVTDMEDLGVEAVSREVVSEEGF